MPIEFRFIVRIDFPALDKLVGFLISRDEQQKQIDALAATVKDLTGKLQQSSTGLHGAVDNSQT